MMDPMLGSGIALAALLCATAPRTEAACEAAGGSWQRAGGKAGGYGQHECYFAPHDEGKRCHDRDECESGSCIPDRKSDKWGRCAAHRQYGCHLEMRAGKASKICRD